MAKVLFIQDTGYEHIGTMSLASVLMEHGHSCEAVINGLESDLLNKVTSYKPDIVGFSVITGSHRWCLDTATRIKRVLECKIIFGGPHATYFPEVINNPQVDYVCRGEGEHALLDLANTVDSGVKCTIKNLWYKQGAKVVRNEIRNLISDLDSLPFPARSIYYKYDLIKKMPQRRFMVTRGCPYSCSFCFNPVLKHLYAGKGTYVRRRSTTNVIAEIESVLKEQPFRTVFFDDDTFILDRNWILSFLKDYRNKFKLRFICLARADLLDEELVKELKQSGCSRLFFGVETGNERLRNGLLGKNLTDERIITAARLLHKYGIKFRAYSMLGLPEETLDDAFKTVELNSFIKTDYPWCSIFQPYPGTDLGLKAVQRNYVKADFTCDEIVPYYSGSVLNKEDIVPIINLQRMFVFAVKFPAILPIVRLLVKLPSNVIFDLIFLLGHAYAYVGSEDISLFSSFREGLRSIKKLFFLKRRIS